MAQEEYPEPDPTLSRDAANSSYEQAPEDKDAGFPPPGPATIQSLGKPKETASRGTRAKAKED